MLREILSLLSTRPPDDAVLIAQGEALKRRVPLLYSVLAINTLAVAFTHHSSAPVALTVYTPATIVFVMLVRMVHWHRLRNVPLTAADARSAIRRTSILACLLSIVMLTWSLALYPHNIDTPRGHLNGQGHVVLYIGLTVICCIFLLMHVRTPALMVTLLVVPPFCLYLARMEGMIEPAVAVNLLFVSAAMFYVLVMFARDFEEMVLSRSSLRELSQQNAKLADTDSVTELPNRRRFFAELSTAEGTAAPFSLAVLDLDRFKQVNDLYGHLAGDRVLAEIGRRLSVGMPADACVARLGGDEFAALLPGRYADRELLAIGERLIAACRAPVVLPRAVVRVGVSIGFSSRSDGSTASRRSYEQADYALCHAKKLGRGRCEVFSPAHEQYIRRASEIEQALRCADLDREVSVHYQPITRAADGRLVAFEALARWHSPMIGAIAPSDFVPVAESSELIFLVTRTVLSKALRVAAEWPPHIQLKINLSMRDVTSSEQMLHLVSTVRASSMAPARLTFEITESALAEDMQAAQTSIGLLRSMGASVAIDDFGTGYSSLSYIHQLAPDMIKIDQSFVARLGADNAANSVVRTILELCRSIGARSLAEGVETDSQVEILREMGCHELQGYHLGKPVPSAATSDLIALSAPSAPEAARIPA